MPDDSGGLVVTNGRAFYTTRAAAGALGIRHSPRPHFQGERLIHNSGAIAPRDRGCAASKKPKKGEPSPAAKIIFPQPENNHGTKIFEEGIRQGRTRDEGTQRRHLEERPLGAEGHKPQAGNRDRPFGSTGCGSESPEE